MSVFSQQRHRLALGAAAIAAASAAVPLFAGPVASASSSQRPNVDTSGVTLNIGNIDGSGDIPWTLAGFQTPYKVNWVEFPDSPPLLQALQVGAINFA